MSRKTRQAIYSATNADFARNTGTGRNFRRDGRILPAQQLDNIYYKDLDGVENPYDRGHLTRRDAISWGETRQEANRASKDSCFYTNVSLQHKNFNQDEWHALEKAIETNQSDQDNRFYILCGPVSTEIDRFVMPSENLKPGRVPSAFWKVIAYVGKESNELEVNAFLVFQDDDSILAKRQVLGNNELDPFKIYQSSTTLIEELTAIEFPEIAFEHNPMVFFNETELEMDETGPQLVSGERPTINTPQLVEVSTAKGPNCGIVFR